MLKRYTAINKPFNYEEIQKKLDKEGYIGCIVRIRFSDIVHGSKEDIDELISEAITGSLCGLTNICYKPVKIEDNDLLLMVEGMPDMDLLKYW